MFLGIPIASYGIFFYVAIIGLLWLSGQYRTVSDKQANHVVFLGAVVGSLVSIALFLVSEFLIGSLCLLCMALYVVNFLLLGITWWGAGTRFLVALAGGVRELIAFAVSVIQLKKGSVAGVLSLLLWGMVAAASPAVTHGVASILHGESGLKDGGVAYREDPVRVWREEDPVHIPVEVGTGAFGDYAKGVPDAPIQIVEFADFECPGCRMLYVALDAVLEKYEGRYQLIFKNYPLDSACNPGITKMFHQNACFAAYFIRCAGEQGQFWEALDYAFTDPILERDMRADNAEVQAFRAMFVSQSSAALGLDAQALQECIRSERYVSRVRQEIAQGDQLGLHSTPSFWVNGRKVERPTPDAFEKIFEFILTQQQETQSALTTDSK